VPQKHRSPGAHVIEQLISIRVVEMRAAAALDDQRFSTHGSERPHGTVHAADEDFFRALEDFAGAAALALQSGVDCAHRFTNKIITTSATARHPWRGTSG